MDVDLAILCQSCGLCCDGSLFGRVALEAGEVEIARKRRLQIVAGNKGFEQPCSALARVESAEQSPRSIMDGGIDGLRQCTIYEERPSACRKFTCRLFELHRRDGGPLEPRVEAVRRARELLGYLQRSGFEQADFERAQPTEAESPEYERALHAYAELMERLERDFSRAAPP